MNRLRFLIFILLLPLISQSQPVKITGTAPGAEGKRIEVITFSDLITFQEKTIAGSLVDSTGNFTLIFNLDQTIYANLSIDFHRVDLFIQPSKSYNFNIAPMNYNEMKEINPFLQSAKLGIEFEKNDQGELNSLIRAFDSIYNDFLLHNFNALYRDRNKLKLDSFRMKVVDKFRNVKDLYFVSYGKYKIASLVQLSQSMNQAEIGRMYFANSSVLYENTEYMDFFNQYFSKYLTATCRSLKFIDYNSILNGAESYKRMMKALEADSTLKKIQLRELVMIKGLMEMFNTAGYKQEKIIALLGSVAEESKFPQNQQIARNMIRELTKLRVGSPAPGFKLKNKMQKEVTLADFKGKPVVLNFWTTYCQGCITEMDRMKTIYDKFSDQINFVSISADKDFSKMLFFVNLKTDFVWNFLHIGEDYNLLKEYNVKSYPLFVLIDGDGNIVQYPAELPGSGLELSITKLLTP
jgi:peroxiredoxin